MPDKSGDWSSLTSDGSGRSLSRIAEHLSLAALAACTLEVNGGEVDVATMAEFDAPSLN